MGGGSAAERTAKACEKIAENTGETNDNLDGYLVRQDAYGTPKKRSNLWDSNVLPPLTAVSL
jgi:hypothetical protein